MVGPSNEIIEGAAAKRGGTTWEYELLT